MLTKKSTKPKKKKRNLNQYKLERKNVPENAKALEVSLSWLFYTFSAFYFKFLQSALQLYIRILWKSLNPKVPSPTPTNEMINQFCARFTSAEEIQEVLKVVDYDRAETSMQIRDLDMNSAIQGGQVAHDAAHVSEHHLKIMFTYVFQLGLQ